MSDHHVKAPANNPFSSPKKKISPVSEETNRVMRVVAPVSPPDSDEVLEEVPEEIPREPLPPLTMDEKSCRCCEYYAFDERLKRADAYQGECRRNAPSPGQGARASWPVVLWKGWCGEWENGVSHEDMVRMARDIGESMTRQKF